MTTTRNTSMSLLVKIAEVYGAEISFTYDAATKAHGAVLSREDRGSLVLSDALANRGYEIVGQVRVGADNIPSIITVAL